MALNQDNCFIVTCGEDFLSNFYEGPQHSIRLVIVAGLSSAHGPDCLVKYSRQNTVANSLDLTMW